MANTSGFHEQVMYRMSNPTVPPCGARRKNVFGTFFLTFTALLVVKLIKMTSITLKNMNEIMAANGGGGIYIKDL